MVEHFCNLRVVAYPTALQYCSRLFSIPNGDVSHFNVAATPAALRHVTEKGCAYPTRTVTNSSATAIKGSIRLFVDVHRSALAKTTASLHARLYVGLPYVPSNTLLGSHLVCIN